ncbi:hypothetical protein [Streptomyces sp. NPDC005438]|uniref:hypothetical protein n=1 Tax=Streptomyces sp. NPDC005438 TaxID=3156880 RepID=UPI0033B370B0
MEGSASAPAEQDIAPDPERWRRPYRPGPWRVAIAAVVLLLVSYVLFSALVVALARSWVGASVCLALAAVMGTFALRLLRVGVWVSTRGLRQAWLLRTVTLDWPQVIRAQTVQQPVKWLGLPRTVQGQAVLVVDARTGEALRPVLTDHNADFLGRPEEFNRAADVVEAWAAEYAPGGAGAQVPAQSRTHSGRAAGVGARR